MITWERDTDSVSKREKRCFIECDINLVFVTSVFEWAQ